MSTQGLASLRGLSGIGFRPRRFWTPRYIRDRVLLELFKRTNPELPWLTRDIIVLLAELLREEDRCFEWGAGRSTVWLGHRVGSLTSVEDHPDWCDRVNQTLITQGLSRASVRLRSSEPVGDPNRSPYVRAVDEIGDRELDLCVVDGKHRGACAVAAVPKIAPGGMILVDNAEWFLDHPTFSPHRRKGRGPLDADWARFEELVAGWRRVWTSNGVWDTALWIRP